MIVLIDVDGVVCDLHTEWLRRYNNDHGANIKSEDVRTWGQLDRPEFTKYLYENLYTDETPMVEGARSALYRLRRVGDEIIFVTACVGRGMFDQKVEWLRRKELLTPNRGLIATLNNAPKWLVRGDVLIDDKPENVTEFIRHGGIGILFSQPWNRNDVAIARMESWDEIEEDGMVGWLKRNVMEVAA